MPGRIVNVPDPAFSSLQSSVSLPALFAPTADASKRFIEFFTANIRNPNTRKAYAWAVGEFATRCEANGLTELSDIGPVHVAAYIEIPWQRLSAPSVKQHLAAIRMLFDWLVAGQVSTTALCSPLKGLQSRLLPIQCPNLRAAGQPAQAK